MHKHHAGQRADGARTIVDHILSGEVGMVVNTPSGRDARADGYALLAAQERPVIMNTKGPSAAGKSTLRPLQRALAAVYGAAARTAAAMDKPLMDVDTVFRAHGAPLALPDARWERVFRIDGGARRGGPHRWTLRRAQTRPRRTSAARRCRKHLAMSLFPVM